jgi:glycosyltransferase involved in cell wall biosynthesis
MSFFSIKRYGGELPEPIKVLHVIDKLGVRGSSVHGVTKYLAWNTPRFDRQRFQFVVCSLRGPEPGGEILEQAGVRLFYLGRNKFDPRTLLDLLKLIRIEQPHILHLHGFGAGNFGRVAGLLARIPHIVHEHVILDDQPLYQTIAERLLSPSTTKAVAISGQVRDYMVTRRKINPAKIEVLFYGIPLEEFRAPDPRDVLAERAALGIAADELVVSTIGRLDKQKGLIYFLRAAAILSRKMPKVRFLMVGDGPDREMLESFARQEGIDQRVIFAGYRKDVPLMLSLSNVFAIPSLFEGGPITLFEAMSMAIPVVGTPTGLMPDVIRDGENGFLAPVGNVEVLAAKIGDLLENPEKARNLGQRGWETSRAWGTAPVIRRFSEIYEEVLLPHAAAGREGALVATRSGKAH